MVQLNEAPDLNEILFTNSGEFALELAHPIKQIQQNSAQPRDKSIKPQIGIDSEIELPLPIVGLYFLVSNSRGYQCLNFHKDATTLSQASQTS